MVAVEITECAFELLLFQQLLLVTCSHQELREVDAAGPVGIDQLQDASHLFRPQVGAELREGADELVPFNHSVPVLVNLLEDPQQLFLILVGVELRSDISINNSL